MSVGHLCEAEAPTEATAETSAPPEENEAVTRRVILSLSNPKGAAGGISSAHKTNSAKRKISLYVKLVGFPVWLSGIGFPHPPLRGPPSPKGKADGYRNPTVGLICLIVSKNIIRVWWRQLAAVSLLFYSCKVLLAA